MISLENARCYIHAQGNLWERALWDYLFDGGSAERVQKVLSGYKNDDGGFGHGLEHDIKAPMSNPLMLEFLLTIMRDTGLPPGSLLEGTPDWVEKIQNDDGSLQNPPGLGDYPRAQWWGEGQDKPGSITGNFLKLKICPPVVRQKTRAWAQENHTLESIQSNNWLFMAYHSFDYFFNEDDFPGLEDIRESVLKNIYSTALAHADQGEMNKLFPFFQFATGPESFVAREAPEGLVDRLLDHLESSQREDGGWEDEHGLPYWQPYFSSVVLLALKRFGRI
ncbi:MAG: hypothetical protein KAH12_01850 [Anaerolineales bacterium]|nr:hypothetical protein [Anaerolineales bacterium]